MSAQLSDENWSSSFKPETQASGAKLLSQDKVSIPSGSDTFIQAYIRVAPAVQVRLSSTDIGTESFTASCSCPSAGKGQFCKHIWAALLCVTEKYPDFLSAKKTIEHSSLQSSRQSSLQSSFQSSRQSPSNSPGHSNSSAKLRASEYRKEQYRKQALRAKEMKRERQGHAAPVSKKAVYPPDVEAALAYFSVNGFPMDAGPSESILGEAKRKLSRVFHPDKGGTHDEIIELNRNCELLSGFLRA